MYQFVEHRLGSPRPTRVAAGIDIGGLAKYLRRHMRGEVRFDAADRAMYSTAAGNYRQVPIGVVIPRDADDVAAAIEGCRRFNAPVVFRGGGTGMAGQTVNVAVLFDISKYMRHILDLDPAAKTARVQPGVVLDHLREEAGRYQLTFGPDPATHNHCTLGGMINNNSCGVHSVMAGRTVDNVHEMEVLTYDGLRMRVGPTTDPELDRIIRAGGRQGEIYSRLRSLRDRYARQIRERFPKIPRRVSGYNLDELLPEAGFNVARALVGTEGTCAAVLEASLRLIDNPPGRALLVLGFEDVFTAGDHAAEVISYGPIACEALDDQLIAYNEIKHEHLRQIQLLPPGRGWLLVEFNGRNREEAEAKAYRLMEDMRRKATPPSMKLFDDPEAEQKVWEVRESGLGATAWIPGHPASWPGWEDSAVAPEKVGNYMRDFRKLLDSFGYECALYGHIGQGCVHCRISFDLVTADGVRKYRDFISKAADLVVSYGGSLSGEHGDGQSRAEFLPKMFGNELVQAFKEFKAIWDQVILWPDTFNNYFHPESAQAAVEVLEEAGYQVLVPQRNLCCGRPLYDYGMLDLAGYKLRQILDALRPQISAGVPMVGLEPSCVSVFRDEMKALLPHDVDAQRLSGKTFTLAEFLIKQAQFEPPSMTGQAIVHGHCHDKSILEFQAEEQLLKRMGLSVNTPDSGCCGIAGSFGFERGDRYDVSIKCGERVLLPTVRKAGPKTLLVADGFSCRTQIQQGAGRRAIHLAQVVRLAMDEERKMAFGRARVTVPRTFGLEGTLPPVDGTGNGLVAPQAQWRKRAPLLMGVAAGSLALTYLASRYGLPALKTRLPLGR